MILPHLPHAHLPRRPTATPPSASAPAHFPQIHFPRCIATGAPSPQSAQPSIANSSA
jgi:hypothetical protein